MFELSGKVKTALPVFFALISVIFISGCASPLPRQGTTTDWRIGPVIESAKLEDSASMFALRPFYSHEETGTNAATFRSVTDILWPLGTISNRGNDRRYWRFLLFYGTEESDGVADNADPYRFRLFPIYFEGRTRDAEEYRAIFPFGGKICNFLVFSRVRFILFPIYADGETSGVEWQTILWPFYLKRRGADIDQLRVFPFYGTREKHNKYQIDKSKFIMWPFWSESSTEGSSVNGSGFVFFPFFGHSEYERTKRGHEENWLALPPLFTYGTGDDGYRKLSAPWPFIRQLDRDDTHERHYWPLYGYATNNVTTREYAIWPLFSRTTVKNGSETKNFTHCPLPFYFHSKRVVARQKTKVTDQSSDSVSTSTYTRVWPLFSHRENAASSFTRFPELSLWSGSQQIERNWAPLWSLYTRRTRDDGARCTDILWGLLSWGRDTKDKGFIQLLWFIKFGNGSRTAAKARPAHSTDSATDTTAAPTEGDK